MRIDEFEWTNLIILDAARHDLYEEVNSKTRKRRTVGSSSEEFIQETFSQGDWSDTVVVTANPHYFGPLFEEETGKKPDEVFKAVIKCFAHDKYWDDELGTVPPEKMVEAVDEAANKYPDKDNNFIIHFMQPHTPFIDSDVKQDEERDMNVWDRLEEGEFSDQEVWKAFKENLEKVMPYVYDVDDRLLGNTVITADHGNAFGENGEYGHPTGSKNPVLRQVPFDKMTTHTKQRYRGD